MNQRALRGLLLGIFAGLLAVGAMLAISAVSGLTNLILLIAQQSHRAGTSPAASLALTTVAKIVIAGGLVGALFALIHNRQAKMRAAIIAAPVLATALLMWRFGSPSLIGWPPQAAFIATLLATLVSFVLFERLLAIGSRRLTTTYSQPDSYSPSLSRRAILSGALGVMAIGGSSALIRKLYRAGTFRYDRTEYKGPTVKAITPTNKFYCVTDNVVDPNVDEGLWHLEVQGLVQTPRTWRVQDLRGMPSVDQESTLMSARNGVGGGLISNAVWTGVQLRDLLTLAAPLANAAGVRFQGVDGHAETLVLDVAMQPNTLLAHRMNDERLPPRQGFPLRLIVPEFYGEKSLKWLSRIELITELELAKHHARTSAVPTFSRIDFPTSGTTLPPLTSEVGLRGVAFAAGRGISRVEVSLDNGASWAEATITYSAGPDVWVIWSWKWSSPAAGGHAVVARAIDGVGEIQRDPLHRINVRTS